MAGIQLGGLFTGIDTATLVSQLLAAEQGTINRYRLRQQTWSDRETALNDLETKLSALKTAVGALADANQLRTFRTTSSAEDIATAETSNSAFEGNHTLEVNQLAGPERWVHTAGREYEEDLVGAGTFLYSYDHQETTITTTSETTLADLVGLINNDANNPGVTANLLYYNHAYHLVLNGNDAGSDYAIAVNASNTQVLQAAAALRKDGGNAVETTRLVELDTFDGALVGGESLTIDGVRHDGTAVHQTFAVTDNTKLSHLLQEIEDAFGGTATATLVNGQIRLTDNTCGVSLLALGLTYDAGTGATALDLPAFATSVQGGSVTASLAGFAAAAFTPTQTARDCQVKVDGYPPGAGEWITRSSNTVDDLLPGVTLHLHNTGTVQLDLTRDTQSVRSKLNAIISAYNAAVAFYRDKTGYNQTTKTAGILMGDLVVSEVADDLRLPLIERAAGFAAGVDPFTLPAEIGLKLDSDGKLSLDSAVFDAALADNYLGVLAVIGAAKTGRSDSNTIQFYGASSEHTTAGAYEVEVTIAGGVLAGARIRRAGETAWRNAICQRDTIMGNSTFAADGKPLYPENSLQLSIDRSQNGTFTAQVQVRQGFAGAMADALDRILDATSGTLPTSRKNMDEQIQHLQDQITTDTNRLKQKQTALVARFARLESTLALLQNQMAALGFTTSGTTSQ